MKKECICKEGPDRMCPMHGILEEEKGFFACITDPVFDGPRSPVPVPSLNTENAGE